MSVRVRFVGAAVMAMAVVGCGGTDANTVDKWMGTMRHFRVVGTIMGEKIDINIASPASNDTTQLWCEREYQFPNDANGMPDYANGHNSEIRVKGLVTINGQQRLLDFGWKRHDWQTQAVNTAVPVIPRDDANSPCGLSIGCTNDNMWLSWTWRNPADNSVMYKSAAQSGSGTLGEYVGTPDTTGLEIPANTGNVGGYATGQWSATESIQASFDANCTKNTVDNSY
jgi:hypothetical protein